LGQVNQNEKIMDILINRNRPFSEYKGEIMETSKVRAKLWPLLKKGLAKLLIDTADTLAYDIRKKENLTGR